MNCGVYKISCGKRYYFGSSKDLDARWMTHQSQLRRGCHGNKFMQRLYNKTRGHGFKFEILIGCAPEQRLSYEQNYLDHHWGDKNLMNHARLARIGGSTKSQWDASAKARRKPITVLLTDGNTKEFAYPALLVKHLGCGERTVYRWIKKQTKPSKKWGVKEVYYSYL